MSQKNNKDIFDYKADSTLASTFAEDYLRQYYAGDRAVTEDEKAVARFIRRVFRGSPLFGRAIDLGCGPTLHHAIMLAPYVQSLFPADYLEDNFKPIQRWVAQEPGCWDWRAYTRFCLEEEGLEVSASHITAREDLTRSRIKDFVSINLLNDTVLSRPADPFDLVTAFYCTEEIALTVSAWKAILRRIVSLVRPGGRLLLTCLENTDFYHIQSATGASRALPCAQLSEADVRGAFLELGFAESDLILKVERTPSQAAEGVSGVILVCAQQRA